MNDFSWGFMEMMKDREFLYGSLIRDLYFLGKVLGRKYFLIRIAYTVFMWGIIISVLSLLLVTGTTFYTCRSKLLAIININHETAIINPAC